MPWCACEVRGPLLRAGTPTARLGGKCLLARPDTVIIKKLSCFNNNLEAIKKKVSHTKEGHGEVSCGAETTLSHPEMPRGTSIASGVAMGTVTPSGLLPHPEVSCWRNPRTSSLPLAVLDSPAVPAL